MKKATDREKLMKEAGRRLKSRRISNEMTQTDAASKVGVTQRMISYIERGELFSPRIIRDLNKIYDDLDTRRKPVATTVDLNELGFTVS